MENIFFFTENDLKKKKSLKNEADFSLKTTSFRLIVGAFFVVICDRTFLRERDAMLRQQSIQTVTLWRFILLK